MRSEHRAPLIASIVVVLACAGVMVHAVRTDALGGLARLNPLGVVAAQVISPRPQPAPRTVVADPAPPATPVVRTTAPHQGTASHAPARKPKAKHHPAGHVAAPTVQQAVQQAPSTPVAPVAPVAPVLTPVTPVRPVVGHQTLTPDRNKDTDSSSSGHGNGHSHGKGHGWGLVVGGGSTTGNGGSVGTKLNQVVPSTTGTLTVKLTGTVTSQTTSQGRGVVSRGQGSYGSSGRGHAEHGHGWRGHRWH